jgi:hypothetical protein
MNSPKSPRKRLWLLGALLALFLAAPALGFTAHSLDITVNESGDAIAVFRFSLEGFIENAIPQSVLEQELLKGLGTSSEPPELIAMDRSSATIRMKQFAALADVPAGTEYRTVTMDFKKAEIALQQSAISSVVSADFSPDLITVTFPDRFSRQFNDAHILPSLTHIVVDPAKAAAAGPVHPDGGAIRVLSSPEGIQVSIDGNYAGTAPGTFADLPAGEHRLEFSKEGYESIARTVTVTEGQPVQVSVFLAYIPPTPTQTPGFFGITGLAALAGAGYLIRLRKRP